MGYGYAGFNMVKSLQRLGHDVPYQDPTADVHIHFSQPPWMELQENKYNVGYVPWESSELPEGWVETMNQCDEIWTPSPLVADWFAAAGVFVPIFVYEHGIPPEWVPLRRKESGPIKFLHCLSEDTEILTEDGWRGIDRVGDGDIVASLDTTSNSIEFVPAFSYISRDNVGEMVSISNWSHDVLVTDEHRMFYRRQGTKTFQWGTAKDFINDKTTRLELPNRWVWKGREEVCVSRKFFGALDFEPHPNANPIKEVLLDDVLTLMGWYISEGSRLKKSGRRCIKTGEHGSSTVVCITQRTNQEYVKEIMDCIRRIGAAPSYTTGGDIVFTHADLHAILGECGDGFYDKKIPRWVFTLGQNHLRVLFDAMVKGDGSRTVEAGCYYTSSPGLKDDVQELLALCSYRTSIYERPAGRGGFIGDRKVTSKHPQFCINFKDGSKNLVFHGHSKAIGGYSGRVWCVSNKNGTLVTRRNGKVSVVGNCGEPAPRKGGQMAYEAFLEVFGNSNDATFTIKAHTNSGIREFDKEGSIIGIPDDRAGVDVIREMLSGGDLVKLFNEHDCLVYPGFGEGFGLIPLQALGSGMPTICTKAWAPYARLILPELSLGSKVIDSPWPQTHPGQMFEPSYADLINAYRYMANNRSRINGRAYRNAFKVHEEYNWDTLTKNAFAHIVERFGP